MDTNLPVDVLRNIALCKPAGGWLCADGVSPAKVVRLRPILAHLDMVYLNAQELAVLSHTQTVAAGIAFLQDKGVGLVVVGQGSKGLTLSGRWHESVPHNFTIPARGKAATQGSNCGTGDAIIAALIHAHVCGEASLKIAANQALVAAQDARERVAASVASVASVDGQQHDHQQGNSS